MKKVLFLHLALLLILINSFALQASVTSKKSLASYSAEERHIREPGPDPGSGPRGPRGGGK